jgi:hypothetical protein
MKTKLKPGFHAYREQSPVRYQNYLIIKGIWVYSDDNQKPVKCWNTYTPDKKSLGCSLGFLDAKEKVKTHRISLILNQNKRK